MSTATANIPQPRVSRRAVLAAGGGAAGLLSLSLTGCGGDNGEPESDSEFATPDPERPLESPMLTELVDAGDLPPLEERLPVEQDRLVVETEEFGVYGGTYQGGTRQEGDTPPRGVIGFEPMLRPSPDLSEDGLPGILKSVDVSDDGTEFTLHLREGMRWSDGEPCTADDVMFAIDDVYLNEEIYPSPPAILAVDAQPASAERVDDYTVTVTFPQPKGDFIDHASRQADAGGNFFYFPKHYMEQFHPDFNDDAEEQADSEGFSEWTSYWENRVEYWNNPEKPGLTAWTITDPLNVGNMVRAERNPYYWKTDTDGAQLPFIDHCEWEIVQDDEVLLLKAVNGEIDFHDRWINSDQNRPVLADAQESGDFHFSTVLTTSMNRLVISFNFNYEDEDLAEIFRNKDFRIGMSHAIDRQEIIDTTLQRQGEPWQAAPRPESEYYDEEMATQYTEYDVDLANQYLDDAGLDERDSDGFRLLPNGDRLFLNIDLFAQNPYFGPAWELVVGYWEDVGVDAQITPMERTLFVDRRANGEHAVNAWNGDGGMIAEMLEPMYWFPAHGGSAYAPSWAAWFTSQGEDENAEEPPEQVRRQMELYWDMQLEPDADEQFNMVKEIFDIAKEEFYTIGIALPIDGYGIVSNALHNVREAFHYEWQYHAPGFINPSTWFLDR